uniref:Uncharacterized protein n=1 Tax=Panagrolaimus superbus TaxID=310955 RepID=A0A914YRN2_9BILA
MFSSPVNSESSTDSNSPTGRSLYAYQCHRQHKHVYTTEVNNNKYFVNGNPAKPAPIEFKPPFNQKTSPFLRKPLDEYALGQILPSLPTSPAPPPATSKKEPVAYIRIWTELYDVYTKIEKVNEVIALSPCNAPFFKRLMLTHSIQIIYNENYHLISNMVQLLTWTPECRFMISARGFCEDFMTFLKTLPRINSVCFRDVCSNESIDFADLLKLLTNVDELEIDMRHIKYKEDIGIILQKWSRPATLKKFILHNVVRGVSAAAVQKFCQDKVKPGGVISVTYEKYPKQ